MRRRQPACFAPTPPSVKAQPAPAEPAVTATAEASETTAGQDWSALRETVESFGTDEWFYVTGSCSHEAGDVRVMCIDGENTADFSVLDDAEALQYLVSVQPRNLRALLADLPALRERLERLTEAIQSAVSNLAHYEHTDPAFWRREQGALHLLRAALDTKEAQANG